MAKTLTVVFLSILALNNLFFIAFAYDTTPLKDLCVADRASTVSPDGLPCKEFSTVESDDFLFSGLHLPGNTTNPFGAVLTTVSVNKVAGLNTLGLVLARLDFKPNGIIPLHIHPRASEAITVLEGSTEVGFIISAPDYKHFGPKVLHRGDFFVIPAGVLHYQRQVGTVNTAAITVLNSQNPGILSVPNGLFSAKPSISSDYLSTALALDKATVEYLQLHYPST